MHFCCFVYIALSFSLFLDAERANNGTKAKTILLSSHKSCYIMVKCVCLLVWTCLSLYSHSNVSVAFITNKKTHWFFPNQNPSPVNWLLRIHNAPTYPHDADSWTGSVNTTRENIKQQQYSNNTKNDVVLSSFWAPYIYYYAFLIVRHPITSLYIDATARPRVN